MPVSGVISEKMSVFQRIRNTADEDKERAEAQDIQRESRWEDPVESHVLNTKVEEVLLGPANLGTRHHESWW